VLTEQALHTQYNVSNKSDNVLVKAILDTELMKGTKKHLLSRMKKQYEINQAKVGTSII
jgi:hypothetical protein